MKIRIILFLLLLPFTANAFAYKCLLVSSYHAGYGWSDDIERGVASTLNGKCELKKFYMDTKRNKDRAFAEQKALEAKALIEWFQPDVVIAADDNASKYLIKPYFKDSDIPFVFCGVNWTVKSYGFPYSNVTGMIEVSPIKPLLREVTHTIGTVKRGVFLAADVPTQHKEFARTAEVYKKLGVEMSGVFVDTFDQWQQAYRQAQSADFIYLSNFAGINDWDKDRASRHARDYAKKLTITTYEWMMPYTMFAMTKIAEEQGEWAAQVALEILGGESPASIPIVANRRWRMYANEILLKKAKITLPGYLQHKAIKVPAR